MTSAARRVLWATLAALLLPGLGHWLSKRRAAAALIFAAMSGALVIAGLHLTSGLAPLETPVGSFAFGVLLRGALILYAFNGLDAYFSALFAAGLLGKNEIVARTHRSAVALNLLLPGAGYLLAKAWVRAATGLLVLVMLFLFANIRYHRYIDIIFIATQLIMAGAVYHQLRAKLGPDWHPSAASEPVAAAQISLMVVVVAALFGCGYVVQLRMPSYDFAHIDTTKHVRIRPSSGGIGVSLEPLALSFTVAGDGWLAEKTRPGELFAARHEKHVSLRVGTQLVLPFVKPERYATQLRNRMESNGWHHRSTATLRLAPLRAFELQFTRPLDGRRFVDQRTVAVVRGHYAILLLIEGSRDSCEQISAVIERTRDSLRLDPPRAPAT